MKWSRSRAAVTAVGVLLLCWVLPYASSLLYPAPDERQEKCTPPDDESDPRATSRPAHDGVVRAIRLTDAGEFVNRCELTDVLYELNWNRPLMPGEYRAPVSLAGEQLIAQGRVPPKLVVLYIHGWKHDASASDPDREAFSELIKRLSHDYGSSKQVLGVYIGWNARSKLLPLRYEPLASLTFWSKKAVADRIAQSTITTKILSAISALLTREGGKENQFIVIGHSFGARLLFSAVGQSLIYDTQKAHPGYPGGTYDEIKGIANAVILLNPAFEASMYTAFDAITRYEERFSASQQPLLLSISSSGDLATRWAFPTGQVAGWASSARERTTLGNFAQYQTHSLGLSNATVCGRPSHSSETDLSEHFEAHGLCMSRKADPGNSDNGEQRVYQPRNPFLIAQTGSEIISGHSDIWNERFSAWLFEYVKELGKYRRERVN